MNDLAGKIKKKLVPVAKPTPEPAPAAIPCPPEPKSGQMDAETPQKAADVKPGGKKPKPWHGEEGRLPDGSEFFATYDAKAVRWHGKLVIPGVAEFVADTGAILRLFPKLDRLYRAHLAKQAEAAKKS